MFSLNPALPVPLYQQLYDQIREAVLQGKLPAHGKLPSVRELAGELSVSRNTVEGAYLELYAEGYLYTRPRSGYFVAPLDFEAAGSGAARPAAAVPETAVSEPRYRYDFHPAGLDPDSFPARLWRQCFVECLSRHARELSHYPSDPAGELSLRLQLRRYLEHSRGVICDAGQIVICSGLQNALDIVAQVLRADHQSVAVEDPGFHLARAVFRNHSFNVIPVPVGPQGLEVEGLGATSCTLAYVTPSHQLPMGQVMPIGNRLKLIEWAGKSNFIIEDDYDSELRYQGKPITSLQGLRPEANVIYLGTFSKILSPALRISYLVLPPSLRARYAERFREYVSPVSVLDQLSLARFMELGHWERHVRRMRNIYRRKHEAMLQSIERHFGGAARVIGQGAGLHVVLHLESSHRDETALISRAAERGIHLFPFSDTCASGDRQTGNLLLGFGALTPGELDAGMALLAEAIL
ncbi:MocR-like pyridoxine biosynthesis transcription factor PdxR [Geomesophilobacter sediminis]|uniref:PLP-dependent aminotransferase family protein n=1 Tax=Geomesophilobacter sediminis TaxID=2798584 RepID=A0A8J7JE47_9BACT|nr:PLP-dependent aminotransferase family protein [Geomesophilobacter sediminis]MBJ6725556.1 PLP-dependent aminotransferase family protein [Geomesophilobacter sediminis]